MLIIVSCLLITGGELVGLGEAAEDQVMVNWAGLAPAAGVAIYTFMVHSEAALVYQLMEVGYAVFLGTLALCDDKG